MQNAFAFHYAGARNCPDPGGPDTKKAAEMRALEKELTEAFFCLTILLWRSNCARKTRIKTIQTSFFGSGVFFYGEKP